MVARLGKDAEGPLQTILPYHPILGYQEEVGEQSLVSPLTQTVSVPAGEKLYFAQLVH
jgi:hypothetical protein